MKHAGISLETMSLVLTADQAARLRQIRDDRATDIRRVSVSDVAREVVAAGLHVINAEGTTDSTTTGSPFSVACVMTRPTPIPADPDVRKTDVAEIATITGWTESMVVRAIRAGQLPGCRYLPSEHGGTKGTYPCAFKPFIRWWRDGIEVGPAPTDDTPRLLRTFALTQTIERLIDQEAG